MTEPMERSAAPEQAPSPATHPTYQPPCIERVVSREDLESEILYAGDEDSPAEW